MNKVFLIGNTTKDVELSETPNGISVCKFSIGVSRDYANADGVRETDFFNITTWRGLAETCAKYLKKGSKVCVVGTLQNRSYEDKDGIKRHITEVIAGSVEFLTPKKESEQAETDGKSEVMSDGVLRRTRPQLTPIEEIDDGKLPF